MWHLSNVHRVRVEQSTAQNTQIQNTDPGMASLLSRLRRRTAKDVVQAADNMETVTKEQERIEWADRLIRDSLAKKYVQYLIGS